VKNGVTRVKKLPCKCLANFYKKHAGSSLFKIDILGPKVSNFYLNVLSSIYKPTKESNN